MGCFECWPSLGLSVSLSLSLRLSLLHFHFEVITLVVLVQLHVRPEEVKRDPEHMDHAPIGQTANMAPSRTSPTRGGHWRQKEHTKVVSRLVLGGGRFEMDGSRLCCPSSH